MNKFLVALFSVVTLTACNIDEIELDNLDIEPVRGVFDFPIGTATYTIRELIEEQGDSTLNLLEDSTSLLTLVYTDSFSYSANDFVTVEDFSETEEIGGLPALFTPIAIIDTVQRELVLAYDNDQIDAIDSIFYSGGTLSTTVLSAGIDRIDYTLEFINTVSTTDGSPVILGNIDPYSESTSLAGYKTLLSNAESDTNRFFVNFTGYLYLNAGDSLREGETISITVSYLDQQFETIFGNFGQDTASVGNQTLNIDFFREMGDNGIIFGNPTLTFDFSNAFGIPLGLDFSNIQGDSGDGGVPYTLRGDIVNDIPVVESADVNNPGDTTNTRIQINKDNSNLVDFLATAPASITVDVSGISNPYDANQINFVQPDSYIDAALTVDIPMELQLDELQQDVSFSLGNGINVSEVDSAYLRIVTLNEFPFSATLSIEILQDSILLYSVPEDIVLNAPFIDIDGFVTDPNGATADIVLSAAGIDALGTGTRMRMLLTLSTPVSQTSRDIFVKILADYKLEIKVGIGGKLNLKP